MDTTLAMVELFLNLSKQLCGFDDLSPKLGEVYYDILNNDPSSSPDLAKLLDTYRQIVAANPSDAVTAIQSKILSDDALRALALNIIKLWYLGVIQSLEKGSPTDTPLQGGGYNFYHEALIW